MDPYQADPGEFWSSSDLFIEFDLVVLAAEFGQVSDDARATAGTLETQGAGGEYQKWEFNLY